MELYIDENDLKEKERNSKIIMALIREAFGQSCLCLVKISEKNK